MSRATLRPKTGTFAIGGLSVDIDGYRAWYCGRSLDLSRSQLELLTILLSNPDRIVSREELSRELSLERGRSVDVLLSLLRRSIGRDFVRNVRDRGWILVPEALGA